MRQHDLEFDAKHKPLRQDVRDLGRLVGHLLREQGGPELFSAVEQARRAAIERREGDEAAGHELDALLGDLSITMAHNVARAFGSYFGVVNLAEKVHRIRRRRQYLHLDAAPQKHSLHDLVGTLERGGVDFQSLVDLLGRLRLEPVFTAHPTQAVRRTLLEKRQSIVRSLVERLDPTRTPGEERAAMGRIRADATSAWQTEQHPAEKPTVAQERENILFYLTDILYRIVPAFYEELTDAIARAFPKESAIEETLLGLPPLLHFASWVGGDMDGNPNVSAATIEESLVEQRRLIIGLYRRDVLELSRQLSQTRSRVAFDPGVDARIEDYSERFPQVLGEVHKRHEGMRYRLLLRLIAARLEATENDHDPAHADRAYDTPDAFVDDLRLIASSLRAHRGEHAGLFWVERLLHRARTFGFHLATLDVRQDSLVHRRAVAQLLGFDDWLELDAASRVRRLVEALGAPSTDVPDAPGDDLQNTLDVMRAIAAGRQRYGQRAVGPHIVSMTQGADDILSVLLLARAAGLERDGVIPLDVAPLFETVPDLRAAAGIMASLVAEPLYRRHVTARDDRQIIMVGYSDSNKEGGLAASRWELHRAQGALAQELGDAGIELTVFHGHGGSVGRGGGARTHQSIRARPAGTVNGRLRFTVQGETIDHEYGIRSIAMRTLERTFSALAIATSKSRADGSESETWRRIMETLARESRRAYRQLVVDDPAFFRYFRDATPVDVIELMTIGSRPSSRRAQRGIEDLRAIPWVFAWTQSRHNLPGWYGLGQGLGAAIDAHGEHDVVDMARRWPFFITMLDDVSSVLAETDLDIARRYAALADDGEATLERIRHHYQLTVEKVLHLRGTDALLDENPTLRRAIRLRNPYVDPMSLLQVQLLKRWRDDGRPTDSETFEALLTTVHGIAQGLQGTG